ncbi:MAG TPA: hypothetical protein VJ943_10260 [Desulfotignum sp.]|nr:hypothetical protein [Desulfotignum sp.]
MKVTDPELIQESEKEFIDTINAELDWESIEKLLMQKHGFALQDEVDYKQGDLVVFDNQIAYRFDFEVKVPLSVVFNRQGECLDMSTSHRDDEPFPAPAPEEMADIRDRSSEKVGQLASNIADMISEINQGDDTP